MTGPGDDRKRRGHHIEAQVADALATQGLRVLERNFVAKGARSTSSAWMATPAIGDRGALQAARRCPSSRDGQPAQAPAHRACRP